MKKLLLLITFILPFIANLRAQIYTAGGFVDGEIKNADLIVEGEIISKTFFQDTTKYDKNQRFEHYAVDSGGIWFLKYEIKVHKIFKGEKQNTISVICPTNFPDFYRILRSHMQNFNRGRDSKYTDFPEHFFGIFFLSKKLENKVRLDTHSYYFVPYLYSGQTNYCKIDLTQIRLNNKGEWISFENVESIYKFIEKETGTNRINIVDKKYIIFKNNKELDEYKKKHLADSAYYQSYQKRIDAGIINQTNIDSFFVKPSPPPSKDEIKVRKTRNDSLNRLFDDVEKRMEKLLKENKARRKKEQKEKTQLNKSSID